PRRRDEYLRDQRRGVRRCAHAVRERRSARVPGPAVDRCRHTGYSTKGQLARAVASALLRRGLDARPLVAQALRRRALSACASRRHEGSRAARPRHRARVRIWRSLAGWIQPDEGESVRHPRGCTLAPGAVRPPRVLTETVIRERTPCHMTNPRSTSPPISPRR